MLFLQAVVGGGGKPKRVSKKIDKNAPRQIDVDKTTFKALAILAMLVVSIISMCYIGWLLWTLPPKK